MTKTIAGWRLVSALTLLPGLAMAATPIAHCRKGDKTESGLQGEVTAAEVASGANKTATNCNTDLVGQYQGEGASWQMTAWKNCAYFDQRKGSNLKNPGTVAVDVSDPAHPKATAFLTDAAMIDPWESLKVNAKRQLLAADQGTCCGPGVAGPGFSIYDISADCAHPVLKAAVNIPGALGHAGQWAPDGNTYYYSGNVIDTSDASNPKKIDVTWPQTVHDLEVSRDGNLIYGAVAGGFVPGTVNGLVILDVSDIQARKLNPQMRVVSRLNWDDGSIIAQNALPVTIAGKPYIVFTD